MSKPKPKLNQKKRASLQQASIIIFMGIAAVIMLALLTYNRELDPGPFFAKPNHSGGCENLAGCKGAWIADFLYGLLGYLSFAVPIVLVVLGLTAFRHPKHLRNPNNPIGGVNTVITIAGAVFTLLAGSGLAHMLFAPGIGGGVLGEAVAGVFIKSFLGFYGSLLLFLAMFIGGVTLVADIPWGDLTEKVGDFTLKLFERLQGSKSPSRERHEFEENFDDKDQKGSDVLSVGKDFLKSGKASAGGVLGGIGGSLLGKVKAAVGLDKEPVRERDIYEERDPLFDGHDDTTDDRAAPEDSALSKAATDEPSESASADKTKTAPKPKPKAVKKFEEPEEQFDLALHDSDQIITLPRLSLLNAPPPARDRPRYSKKELSSMSDNIVESLRHYNVGKGDDPVRVVNCEPGPVITRFELQLPDGTKASKVSGLANDLARNLCVSSVRVVEVIPGKPTIGLEIPNEQRDVVAISEILNSDVFRNSRSPLTLALGKDIAGKAIVVDLARMPHLLVAGTTGSGKSVAVNAMLMSLLYKSTPEEVKLILIDPKMLELSSYENIPHLLAPVVTDMKEAASALRWCVAEMERRYLLMSKLKVRNIAGYNAKIREAQDRDEQIPDPLFDPLKSMDTHPQPLEPLPYIVIVIDEFADMMMIVGKKVEELIARLAQKARAAGIHLILATQRPSVDVITGLIKANIPSRIAFQVSTKIDSRTILDQGGAEQLLGYGDMLYMPPGTSMPQRVHGALVTDQEVEDVATYLKQQMEPDYVEGVLADTGNADGIPGLEPLSSMGEEADPLYDEAVAIVTESRRASISYLQRRLKVGYNRAARMIEDMEVAGVVSPVQSNGSREVIAPPPIQS